MVITMYCIDRLQTNFLIRKVIERININHELYVKSFFTGSPVLLPQWFQYGHNCYLKRKSVLDNFQSYLNNQAETFSFIFEELSQTLVWKN